MKQGNRAFLLGFTLLILLSSSISAIETPTSNFAGSVFGIFSPIINLFQKMNQLSIDNLEALTRFMIWIVVFAILYGVMRALSKASMKWMAGSIAIVLAFAFATISAIYMPKALILQIGGTWAQVAFLILLVPILALFGWYAIKQWNEKSTTHNDTDLGM